MGAESVLEESFICSLLDLGIFVPRLNVSYVVVRWRFLGTFAGMFEYFL